MRFVVVGEGEWGTVFGGLLVDRGHDVSFAGRTRADEEFDGADVIVAAIPSRSFGEVVESLPGTAPLLSLTKGLDPDTGGRLSSRVRGRTFSILSGPNIAHEIADGHPAAAVIASEDDALALKLQHAINSPTFRVYVNNDPAGVELAAAAKNVIALAAGAMDGLRLGDNSKAALITLGLAELRRLGVATGARAETFAGLAGTGDVLVTCWSRHSRNRRAGALMARGATPQDALRKLKTVEGLTTAPILRDLSESLGIELPITNGIVEALQGRPIGHVIAEFMRRPPTGE
jgi:glycerol-3-phosphate dehydrogenase (NAD(P)+)